MRECHRDGVDDGRAGTEQIEQGRTKEKARKTLSQGSEEEEQLARISVLTRKIQQ